MYRWRWVRGMAPRTIEMQDRAAGRTGTATAGAQGGEYEMQTAAGGAQGGEDEMQTAADGAQGGASQIPTATEEIDEEPSGRHGEPGEMQNEECVRLQATRINMREGETVTDTSAVQETAGEREEEDATTDRTPVQTENTQGIGCDENMEQREGSGANTRTTTRMFLPTTPEVEETAQQNTCDSMDAETRAPKSSGGMDAETPLQDRPRGEQRASARVSPSTGRSRPQPKPRAPPPRPKASSNFRSYATGVTAEEVYSTVVSMLLSYQSLDFGLQASTTSAHRVVGFQTLGKEIVDENRERGKAPTHAGSQRLLMQALHRVRRLQHLLAFQATACRGHDVDGEASRDLASADEERFFKEQEWWKAMEEKRAGSGFLDNPRLVGAVCYGVYNGKRLGTPISTSNCNFHEDSHPSGSNQGPILHAEPPAQVEMSDDVVMAVHGQQDASQGATQDATIAHGGDPSSTAGDVFRGSEPCSTPDRSSATDEKLSRARFHVVVPWLLDLYRRYPEHSIRRPWGQSFSSSHLCDPCATIMREGLNPDIPIFAARNEPLVWPGSGALLDNVGYMPVGLDTVEGIDSSDLTVGLDSSEHDTEVSATRIEDLPGVVDLPGFPNVDFSSDRAESRWRPLLEDRSYDGSYERNSEADRSQSRRPEVELSDAEFHRLRPVLIAVLNEVESFLLFRLFGQSTIGGKRIWGDDCCCCGRVGCHAGLGSDAPPCEVVNTLCCLAVSRPTLSFGGCPWDWIFTGQSASCQPAYYLYGACIGGSFHGCHTYAIQDRLWPRLVVAMRHREMLASRIFTAS
ncbi:unnamed protein product [Amoebophrya sp. A25]|nr:unnamed protein product [Amoebophrya sp. A25]|eukprot:GSA25T00011659001.1